MLFTPEQQARVRAEFRSFSVGNDETIEEIRGFHAATGYVLDPHTAVGVRAGRSLSSADVPMICLATAHPAKFPDAVRQATGRVPELPAHMADIYSRKERFEVIANDVTAVKQAVRARLARKVQA